MAGKRLRNEALQERPDRINRASVTLYVLASLLGRTNKLATNLSLGHTHTYARACRTAQRVLLMTYDVPLPPPHTHTPPTPTQPYCENAVLLLR